MKFNVGDYVWIHIIDPFKKIILAKIEYIDESYYYPYVCKGVNGEVMYADDEWASEYIIKKIPEYFSEI